MTDLLNYQYHANVTQQAFLDKILAAARRENPYRVFFYGGAVRGGKTYMSLAALMNLAYDFPGLRAHIVRDSLPNLKNTVLPSLKKLCDKDNSLKWRLSGDKQYLELENGSRLHFFSESAAIDPDLDRFKGLETNVFLLEQLEELRRATFQKALERAGSYYFDGAPPGLILATFNPAFNWVKDEIYQKYLNNDLPQNWLYQTALPTHNPFVTEDQKQNWLTMDKVEYNRFILGDWEAKDATGLFLYNFDKDKHCLPPPSLQPALPFWLSFDFNISPMTCLLAQFDGRQALILKEFRQENIGLEAFLEKIKPQLLALVKGRSETELAQRLFVTGDPAGRNRSALAGAGVTAYVIIEKFFKLPARNIELLKRSPTHADSYNFCNAVFHRDRVRIDPSCRYLIRDLESVKMQDAQIDKANPANGHLLDALRYFLHLKLEDQFSQLLLSVRS